MMDTPKTVAEARQLAALYNQAADKAEADGRDVLLASDLSVFADDMHAAVDSLKQSLKE